ncbi:MAG: hypothetical protein BMS9Abin05_1026 [Rhodothermia bacterium]|nr:MAG: hypothetical protein BMS9Abin05_1026 [Rhodothermia bacterium]
MSKLAGRIVVAISWFLLAGTNTAVAQVPDISVDPTSFDYGSVFEGDTSDRGFIVRNDGTATLNVVSTELLGTNPGQFQVVQGGGIFSIGTGNTRLLNIRFGPTAVGLQSAFLRLVSDDPDESPFDIPLTGTGIGVPDISISPGTMSFGDVKVGSTRRLDLIVTNTGSADLTVTSAVVSGIDTNLFEVVPGLLPFTVAPLLRDTIRVDFTPLSGGDKSGFLTVSSNDPDENPLLLTLTGRGVRPDISVNPTIFDYGDVAVGSNFTSSFAITNTGTGSLVIQNVTIDGVNPSQFAITSGGGGAVINPGNSRNVNVRFTPTSLGSKSARFRIESDDPDENPFIIPLTGTGIGLPDISVNRTTVAFGNVPVEATTVQEVIVTNLGLADLIVSTASFTGPNADQFGVQNNNLPVTLAPQERDTVRVAFAPTSTGNKSAFLNLTSNDPDESPTQILLSGQGVRSDISADMTSYDFGDVAVGINESVTFTITNLGSGNLVIFGSQIQGNDIDQFLITGGAGGATITPGNSRLVTVRFTPISLGDKSAVLSIDSDDPDENPFIIPLSGTGIGLPDILVNRTTVAFGNVPVEATAVQEVIVTNLGLADLIVSTANFTGPNADQFGVQSNNLPFTLAPQERDTVRVAFTPTSTGNKSAFLNLSNNDPDESPTQILLSGQGVRSDISVDMTSYDFGEVAVGTNESVTFTITNLGTGNLVIFGSLIQGSDIDQFLITGGAGGATITPGNSRLVTVRFTPISLGDKSAVLSIESDDADGSPLDIPLTGKGFGQPDISVNRTVVSFNNVRVGMTNTQEIIVVNTGLADLEVTDASYIGTDAGLFATQPGTLPIMLSPEERDTLRVDFTPLTGGNKSASMLLSSNDPDESPLEILLTGEAVRPEMVVDISSYDFGELATGTSSSISFSITNTGTGNLIIFVTEIQGIDLDQFIISGGGGAATIASNNTRVITVDFVPTTIGPKSAALHIESDDLVSPVLDLQLTGVSIAINVETAELAPAGQDVAIGISLPPGFLPSDATLFYRLAGETTYRTASMSPAGSELVAVIPGSAASLSGIEYYIVATNTDETITLPVELPQTNPIFLPVRVEQAAPPPEFVLQPLLYRMISVPINLDNPGLTDVLADDYGPYNTRRWRLFRWENGDYIEFPDIDATFTQGAGFWLVTSDGALFDVDGGRSVDPTSTITLDLVPGWNQIGNPYAFSFTWPANFIDPGIEAPVWFDGLEFQFGQTALDPWEGYFVYNSGNSTVSVPISLRSNPLITGKSDGHSSESAIEGSGEYTVQITAEIPGTVYRDTQNRIGVRMNALDGRDAFDYAEPPPIGDYLQLSIIESGERFAGSFKAAGAEGAYWDLQLTGTAPRNVVTVSLIPSGDLPPETEFHVLDLDDRRAIEISDLQFNIELQASDSVRRIRLIVGTKPYAEKNADDIELVPSTYDLEQNYPNPFNPETVIRYSIGRPSSVRLAVFDLLGRRVRTLVNSQQEAGNYTVRWDGRNSNGLSVSSGVYLYRLETGDYRASRRMVVLR